MSAPRPRGTVKDRALRLLAVRWRSREELRRRLRQAGFEDDQIEEALDDLERVGLVEEQRFARELVRDRAVRRLSGDREIRTALREKGVAAEIADAALGELGDERERAAALAARRAFRLAGLQPEAAYQRLYGALVRRGFGSEVAREASRAALREGFEGRDIDAEDGP